MTLAGNLGLLDRLVTEHMPEALRFALRLTGREETAEEVVQEALYRAVRSIGSFRGQAQFRTWFYRIVIRAFHDHWAASTRGGPMEELSEEIGDPHDEDPVAATIAGELQDLIAQRIAALPIRQREVLILITYEQLRPREVADVLGISESNVHANLHYARARLREELSPYLDKR